jgi:hypothetical protein
LAIALKAAIIPVDEKEALKKHWGRMPLPDLITALKAKAPPDMVLRGRASGSAQRSISIAWTLRKPYATS